MQKISPCLWFDHQAEEAANFYCSVFKNSKIKDILYYGEEGQEVTGKKPGTVLTVEFEIDGQNFIALNGGPQFTFSEAVSFSIECKDQEEVDYYWNTLTKDGGEESQCGWLKDKFGVSWQVNPTILVKYLSDPDKVRAGRVMNAMLKMQKIDIAALEKAYKS